MLTVKRFTFNPFAENTYIVYNEQKKSIIIDPGCREKPEEQELDSFIQAEGLDIQQIVLTHTHLDHVFGLAHAKDKYNVEILGHPNAQQGLSVAVQVGEVYGIPIAEPPAITKTINEGEQIDLDSDTLQVLFCPGHSADHIVLYAEKDEFCIVGDVIFEGSIGRTDLPGGDFDTLIASIKSKILTLPAETSLFPGHGEGTTVGKEIKFNPFLK